MLLWYNEDPEAAKWSKSTSGQIGLQNNEQRMASIFKMVKSR